MNNDITLRRNYIIFVAGHPTLIPVGRLQL